MDYVKHLKCLLCGTQYDPDKVHYVCPKHGHEGILDVQYDYQRIADVFSPQDLRTNPVYNMWRYKALLPIKPHIPIPPILVGWTPLYFVQRLADSLGLQNLWIKDESRQPTGSLKDRASAIAIIKAIEAGKEIITTASTGNAAAALSGLCASVGQKNVIFVPESAPEAKVAQLLVFGSKVLLVRGTYDEAFELCLQASEAFGWYNRNTAFNPYMTEGKKTVIFEIFEQMGWQGPDCIFTSAGDGCILGGLHKGVRDLLALGWIKKPPRLIGVQASGSAALYHAWQGRIDPQNMRPIPVHTIADSLAAGLPRDRIKALRAVRETGGAFLTVTDQEMLRAIPSLARGCGVFAEPAGAASFAGLVKAVKMGLVSSEEKIVIIATGSGLKDTRSAMQAGGKPKRIKPHLEAVKAALHPLTGNSVWRHSDD